MPIVPGNEPRQTSKNGGSINLGWVLPLLIFGPTLYRFARNSLAGRVTDQQLLILGGGLVGLIALWLIVQRINRMRKESSIGLPTSYTLPTQLSAGSVRQLPTSDWKVPAAPKYEPMVTGKVMLAGVVLAALMGGLSLLLLM